MRALVLGLVGSTCGNDRATSERQAAPSTTTELRVRDEGSGELVVALLHGYGGSPSDFDGTTSFLRESLGSRVVRPFGPGTAPDVSGGTWFDFMAEDRLGAQLARTRGALLGVIGRIERESPSARIVIGGFSQGAMMALDFALHHRDRIDAVLVLSGRALPTWTSLGPLREVPVLVTHGRRDQLLSLRDAERLRDRLNSAGARVTFFAYDAEHHLTRSAEEQIVGFLRSLPP